MRLRRGVGLTLLVWLVQYGNAAAVSPHRLRSARVECVFPQKTLACDTLFAVRHRLSFAMQLPRALFPLPPCHFRIQIDADVKHPALSLVTPPLQLLDSRVVSNANLVASPPAERSISLQVCPSVEEMPYDGEGDDDYDETSSVEAFPSSPTTETR